MQVCFLSREGGKKEEKRKSMGEGEGGREEVSYAHCLLPTRKYNGEAGRKLEVTPTPVVFLLTQGYSVFQEISLKQ